MIRAGFLLVSFRKKEKKKALQTEKSNDFFFCFFAFFEDVLGNDFGVISSLLLNGYISRRVHKGFISDPHEYLLF